MDGDFLIFWTVRLALACYALVGLGWLLDWQGSVWRGTPWQQAARLLWTLGCALFVGHVVSAFHFHHQWDHGHAYAETGRRTAEAFGVNVGAGVYVNHAFTLLWIADAAWWWLAPESYLARGGRFFAGLHAWFLFMAFNGAIVFASPPMRYASLGVLAAAALAWALHRLQPASPPQPEAAGR